MRTLYANEIECRVGNNLKKGVSLLLYKDARVDMRILDETYGPMNWERNHEVVNGNLFCTIRVWDKEKSCWISKQDVGTESFTEKEKGEASDSFKRAGFNWGIGRELYTAPFIWIAISPEELDEKERLKTKFVVREIDYNDNREISYLVITDTKGNPRFTYGKKKSITLEDAISEMRQCASYSEVVECWKKHSQFNKEQSFITACSEQGKKYKQ